MRRSPRLLSNRGGGAFRPQQSDILANPPGLHRLECLLTGEPGGRWNWNILFATFQLPAAAIVRGRSGVHKDCADLCDACTRQSSNVVAAVAMRTSVYTADRCDCHVTLEVEVNTVLVIAH